MKISLACLVFGLCALAIAVPVEEPKYKVASKDFLKKQKEIFELYKYVNQPSFYKEHVEFAEKFDFQTYKTHFTKPEVWQKFYDYYHYQEFLPKGEIFSIFNYEHQLQAKVLFDIFYYAKDYQTFYNFAVWARHYLNEGLFVYTFSVAIVHRPDTYGIVIPPIYEVYPYYFFNSEVIHKAQYYKQVFNENHEHKDGYYIWANYTGDYLNVHPEQSMSYFYEDVGLNTYYYYFNLYYPFFLDAKEYGFANDKQGQLYYFFYQQFLARYYLERLSNDFGEIPYFSWQVPFETYYTPSLTYHNGLEFPSRPKFAHLYEYFYNYGESWTFKSKYGYSYTYATEYEQRIHEAIDFGYAFNKQGEKVDLYSEEGFNILGNLIQGNPQSPHPQYYGSINQFARHLLGYAFQPLDSHHLAPSALEHFETSLRDPAFYQLYKKIIYYYFRYISHLPYYTYEQLNYPGVEVTNVKFDRLITYFDYFTADISAATYFNEEEFHKDNFHVYAKQERLNHKPFNYEVTVKSEKQSKAVVKIFLGPKYDEYGRYINISQNVFNFVLFDYFTYDLVAGENVIKRNSDSNHFYGPDRESFYKLYKQVEEAYKGQGEYKIYGNQQFYNFPKRFMLPMGKDYGMPFEFFVFVYPYEEYHGEHQPMGEYYYPHVGSGAFYFDKYPLGYPFDRFIHFEKMWYDLPNAYFYEAKIYHKTYDQVHGH